MQNKNTKVVKIEGSTILESFSLQKKLRDGNKFCDVTLKAGVKSFSAHRIVLSGTMPYLNSMLSNKKVHEHITIKGIESSALEKVLDYAYGQEVYLDQNNVQSLLIASSILLMQELRKACCSFLISTFELNNVFTIKRLAESINSIHLKNATNEYIRNNFSIVAASKEFLNIELEELITFIKQDDLRVASEETIFECCVSWVKQKEEQRIYSFSQLLAHVRFPFISPHYLLKSVAKEALFTTAPECNKILNETFFYHLLPQCRTEMKSFKTNNRCYEGYIYVTGGVNSNFEVLNTVEIYDPFTNCWKSGEPLPTKKWGSGVAFFDEKLYIFGGENSEEALVSSVEVFHPKENKWSQSEEMLTKRSFGGTAVLNNKAYVCGGTDGITHLDVVDCYCPIKGNWEMVTRMVHPRMNCCAVTINELLYVIGGENISETSYFSYVECFDPQTNKWKELNSMSTKRSYFGATSLNGKIYVCGGHNSTGFLKSAEVYDPVNDVWMAVASMNSKRKGLKLISYMEKLWAIGGYDGVSDLTSVETYDLENDAWNFVEPMNNERAYFGGAAVKR